ncbi:retinol dehydrogenase 11 [Galendromus occidentalis]|uniref:Retinol dehydrogenase 11 n=1 Tax=Galendromus occidentalis TaxID=34638 RepID=A0AAJ7SI34_9ACAR|nr:retinol dehydrogenase 11 [Galendromus occidentalis]
MDSMPSLPIPEALTVPTAEPAIASPVILLISGLFAVVAVFALLCKVYALVTEGHYVCRKDLTGKVIIITGSNTGLGKTTAMALAQCGARIILACRTMTKAEAARDEIIKETGNKDIHCKKLDLASFKSVREFAAEINATEKRLDVLINNAGLLTPAEHMITEDGHEVSIQSNHLGHFLLTNLLLGLLKKSAPSRIVVVGSCGQWFGNMNPEKPLNFSRYHFPLFNYCSTKVLNMLFTVELSWRLKDSGVTVNCGHPGFVQSDFGVGDDSYQAWLFTRLLKLYGKTPEKGAMTSVYLATSDDVTTSGRYFADCNTAIAPFWAINKGKAKKLWEVSERMTGLAFTA